MNLNYILQNRILSQELVYTPQVVPVDYCGLTVYNFSLCLSDGASLTHSSLEFPALSDDESRFGATLALLQKSVDASGLRPRCDYLDAALTKAYRLLAEKPAVTRLISACLCGECCRYDGSGKTHPRAAALLAAGSAAPVCPELFGGLAAPRPPCELFRGRVVDCDGLDRTDAFSAGAQRTLEAAQALGVSHAILKERSPSCGSHFIYDGSFSGRRIPGQGLTAALLQAHGVAVLSEEDL